MVPFIQQSLERRITKQWYLLFNSHYNKGYQNNGLFYSAVTRTKDIKTMVSFIQQSYIKGYQNTGFFYSAVTITDNIKTMGYFIQQPLELRISTQWCLLFKGH